MNNGYKQKPYPEQFVDDPKNWCNTFIIAIQFGTRGIKIIRAQWPTKNKFGTSALESMAHFNFFH